MSNEIHNLPDEKDAQPKAVKNEAAVSITASAPEPKTTKMTDSGITHTIPNDSVITVTRHTVITTGKNPQTTSDTTIITTSALPANPSATVSSPPPLPSSALAQSGSSLSTGTIVGIAVGGIAVLAALCILGFFWKRRRRDKRRSESPRNGGRGDDVRDEKHVPQAISAHTTGTQANSDPFAPFGGRADDPHRPPSNVFEMDATQSAPIELPVRDQLTTASSAEKSTAGQRTNGSSRTGYCRPADPRANLNSIQTENGQPTYINQWNQWRNLESS